MLRVDTPHVLFVQVWLVNISTEFGVGNGLTLYFKIHDPYFCCSGVFFCV